MKKITILFWYLLIFIGLTIVVLANSFHARIAEFFPFLPIFFVPVGSIIVIFFVIVFFWQREQEVEMFKYQFLTIVTHKFRTALAGIKWAFDELSREKITIEEKNDLIKNIDQSVRKLVELVDHLAGIAKYDSRLAYAFKAISLREMVDEALGQYGQHIREKDLNLQINTTQDVPLIIADAKKISFVINSLIENAVKYTPKGGQIEVAIKKQSDQIIFSVHNSGKGLGRREKKMLFTKFFRSEAAKLSDPEGLGMALFISKVIVKHHRGQIWAESKGKDKGVTFFVKLKTAQ